MHKFMVKERFSRHAGSYDRHARVQQEMAAALMQLVQQLEDEPRVILEIGCGTGRLTSLLLHRFPRARVVALDIAPGMVEETCRRVALEAHRCRFVLADAEEWVLNQADGSYDLITSSACFQWFTAPDRTVSHLCRLLAPGGRLVFSTFGPGTFAELHDSFAAAHRTLELPAERHGLTFLGPGDWMQALKTAGFHPCVIFSRQSVLYYPGVRDFLHAVKGVGASASQARSLSGLGGRRLLLEMIRQYDARYRTPQGIPATYELLFACAERPRRGICWSRQESTISEPN